MKLFFTILLLVSGCKKEQGFQFLQEKKQGAPPEIYKANEYTLQTDLDILFVIDNSGSMYDKQVQLANNAQLVIDSLINNNVLYVNWRIGFISTDYYLNKTSYPVLDRTTPNVITQFANTVRSFGSNGSGYERAISSAHDFLNLNSTKYIRPSTHFAMIILSDEDENGNESSVPSMNYNTFYQGLLGQVGAKEKLSTFAIVEKRTNSRYETQLRPSALGFYGTYDIRSGDFKNEVKKLTENLSASLKDGFVLLGKAANPETISVSIEGYTIPPLPKGYWYYDPEVYAVVFTDTGFLKDIKVTGRPKLIIDFKPADID